MGFKLEKTNKASTSKYVPIAVDCVIAAGLIGAGYWMMKIIKRGR